MPSIARKNVVKKKGGFFHVLNRINGLPGWYPLQEAVVSRKFVDRLRWAVLSSCIHCAGFTVMGTHFQLVLFVEEFRKLSRRKLERFAKARWGKLWKLRTCAWSDERWERFNRDLFDLSGFMRDLQGPFTTWFNLLTGHQGRLWRDRFKCLALGTGGDLVPMQENLLYVELNPVRAQLIDLPEEWEGGSAYLRKAGQADFLIPRRMARRKGKSVAIGATARKLSEHLYRALCYGQEYVDQGAQAYEARYQENRLKAAKRIAKSMGYTLVPVENTDQVSALAHPPAFGRIILE